MPKDIVEDLEKAIHHALPVSHIDVDVTSDECGYKCSLIIVSDKFEGKSTLNRHRLVNTLLEAQIKQMHAFSQKTFTPKEYEDYLEIQKNQTSLDAVTNSK